MERETYRFLERRVTVAFLLGILMGTLGVLSIQGMIGDLKILFPTLGILIVSFSILAALITAISNNNVPRAIWIILGIGFLFLILGKFIIPQPNRAFEANSTSSLSQTYYRSICPPQMQSITMFTWDSYGEKPVQSIPCNVSNIVKLDRPAINRNGTIWLFAEYQGIQGWVNSKYLN